MHCLEGMQYSYIRYNAAIVTAQTGLTDTAAEAFIARHPIPNDYLQAASDTRSVGTEIIVVAMYHSRETHEDLQLAKIQISLRWTVLVRTNAVLLGRTQNWDELRCYIATGYKIRFIAQYTECHKTLIHPYLFIHIYSIIFSPHKFKNCNHACYKNNRYKRYYKII